MEKIQYFGVNAVLKSKQEKGANSKFIKIIINIYTHIHIYIYMYIYIYICIYIYII